MNDRLIALPSDETLAAQLLSLRYDVTSSGQVKLESNAKRASAASPLPTSPHCGHLPLARSVRS